MNVINLLKFILKKAWRLLCLIMMVLGFAIVIGLTLFAHFSPPCTSSHTRMDIPLANSDSNIVVIDNDCSADTEIFVEDRKTYKRKLLVSLGWMENDIKIDIVDNQIIVTVPTLEGISRHMDKVDAYPVVFRLKSR